MLKLYFAPGRSWYPRWLLDELEVPYELVQLDLLEKEQKQPAYLQINPLGKVPALEAEDGIVTEAAAICLYLADRYADRGLAPAIGDPDRGRYLTLMVHGSTALEPSILDALLKRESDNSMVGWGALKDEFAFVEHHLGDGPYLFGERFTAADTVVGGVIVWAKMAGISLPAALDEYAKRLKARPALAHLFAEAAQNI